VPNAKDSDKTSVARLGMNRRLKEDDDVGLKRASTLPYVVVMCWKPMIKVSDGVRGCDAAKANWKATRVYINHGFPPLSLHFATHQKQ
jgi:hypothetical protein